MEEMAAVQEENVREKEKKDMERKREREIKEMKKEIKDMERENEIKNDEINQLQEKLKKYQVRKCRNCLEVEESCKHGERVTYPKIGLKVEYYQDRRGGIRIIGIITEYKTLSVDLDGVVTFTATLIATTPACKAGEKRENISSSTLLWYACQ